MLFEKDASHVLHRRQLMRQRLRNLVRLRPSPKNKPIKILAKTPLFSAGLRSRGHHADWKWVLRVRRSLSGGSIIQARPPTVLSGHQLITQCLLSSNKHHEWDPSSGKQLCANVDFAITIYFFLPFSYDKDKKRGTRHLSQKS